MSTAAIGSPQQALPEALTGAHANARADARAGAFSGAPADALAATLADAIALADAQDGVRAAAQALRERYAPRRIVVVDAFDMRGETPAAVGEKVQLYFAASDGHCWQVTADGAQAVGFFIAARS